MICQNWNGKRKKKRKKEKKERVLPTSMQYYLAKDSYNCMIHIKHAKTASIISTKTYNRSLIIERKYNGQFLYIFLFLEDDYLYYCNAKNYGIKM